MKKVFLFFGVVINLTSVIYAQKFAVIGDYGLDSPDEAAVADMIKSWEPEFIITVGDNNYHYGLESTIDRNIGKYYHDYISNYQGTYGEGALTNRFYPTLGNHDVYTDDGRPYFDYFELPGNERYYDFVKGNIHFFALNSTESEPDGITSTSNQAMWLKEKLSSSTSKWKVVYFHHPPYSTSDYGETQYMQWPFADWGATAVLSGHDHLYERLEINKIVYFINGVGGNSIYDIFENIDKQYDVKSTYNKGFGAMMVIASQDSIHFEFHSITDGKIDEFTIKDDSRLSLFSSNEILELTIKTNLEELLEDRGEERNYYQANITLIDDNEEVVKLDAQLKVRGNFRRDKDNCSFPPFWIKFSNKDTRNTIFESNKKLKIVNPCELFDDYNQFIMQEYLGYRIYNLLTDSSFRVRPVKIRYIGGNDADAYDTFSFLIEDSDQLAHRMNAKEIKDFPQFTNIPNYHNPPTMELFQYMIGNDDWAIPDHNMKVFVNNDSGGRIMVPYDFDLSKVVSAEYAYFNGARKIFRGFCRTKKEFITSFRLFNQQKRKIEELYFEFEFLDQDKKDKTLKFIERFYRIINNQERRQVEIFDHCSDDF